MKHSIMQFKKLQKLVNAIQKLFKNFSYRARVLI